MQDILNGQPNPILQTMAAYDSIASRYAATWFDDPALQPIIERFLKLIPAGSTVLDAGCGPGRDVRAMRMLGVEAVGVDISEKMLSEARARVPEAIFRRMNLCELTYPPMLFGGIWACASVQHLPAASAERALAEFARVLASDGILFITVELGEGEQVDEYGRYRRLYNRDEFRGIVMQAGFTIMEETIVSRDKSTLPTPRPKSWLELIAKRISRPTDDCVEEKPYSCMLCPENRFALNRELGIFSSSSVVWGNDRLYLAPDLAPLTEGHLLLVATNHMSCFGASSEQLLDEVINEQDIIRELNRSAYGSETCFLEHGPVRRREAGSCIDHSHLHCIPISINVRAAVQKLVAGGRQCTLHELRSLYAAGQSYIYIEDTDRIGCAFPLTVAPTQYLRQVVAALLHVEWQWQTSCKSEVTRERFRRTLSTIMPVADRLRQSN